MACDDAAEHISALCDGETIPQESARHIADCPDCQRRLKDYLALGVELRRTASLELTEAVRPRNWSKSQNAIGTWWQKGLSTMRIPRVAFAALILGIVALASIETVDKARAHETGTVVLLSTVGADGPLGDCALSTDGKGQAMCMWFKKMGPQIIGYKVKLLSRDGDRVLLAIGGRTYRADVRRSFQSSDFDSFPAKQVWLEPGEPLKLDVPVLGTLTLKGEWMDHMPILVGMQKQDLDPGPDELRLGRPLLLKDKVMVGDLSTVVGDIYSQDEQSLAMELYVPGEGRFLLGLLPMKGAVEARVILGRISFQEDGHSWELVSGVPVCRRENRVWVLHQPEFRMSAGQDGDSVFFRSIRLVQAEPGLWVPQDIEN